MHCLPKHLFVMTCCLAPLFAQVPDGWFVVSSFAHGTATPGGLFLTHPRSPGAPLVVQGLGPDLTGVGANTTGANCVAVEQNTGEVLVGEIGPPGTNIDLHRIAITGNVATRLALIPVGTVRFPSTGGGINAIAMLPDGDAILAVTDLVNQPPFHSAILVRYSRSTGALTAIPTGPLLGNCNAVTVNPSGNTIYFVVSGMGLFSLPIAGGPATMVTNQFGNAQGLAVDSQDRIYVTDLADLYRIDPSSTGGTTSFTVGANINGVSIEAATDQPVTVLNGLIAGPGVHWCTNTGTANLLTNGITGVGSGIAVRNSPRSYGEATPGSFVYRWRTAPAPGGLPLRGNLGFGLRVDPVGSQPSLGFLVANWQPGFTTLLGMQVLIDPNNAVNLGLLVPGTVTPAPLPASLPAGLQFYVQGFFVDTGAPQGIAATDGQVVVTIQ